MKRFNCPKCSDELGKDNATWHERSEARYKEKNTGVWRFGSIWRCVVCQIKNWITWDDSSPYQEQR